MQKPVKPELDWPQMPDVEPPSNEREFKNTVGTMLRNSRNVDWKEEDAEAQQKWDKHQAALKRYPKHMAEYEWQQQTS